MFFKKLYRALLSDPTIQIVPEENPPLNQEKVKKQRPLSGHFTPYTGNPDYKNPLLTSRKYSETTGTHNEQSLIAFKNLKISGCSKVEQEKKPPLPKEYSTLIQSLVSLADLISQDTTLDPLFCKSVTIYLSNSLLVKGIAKSKEPLGKVVENSKSETPPSKLITQCFSWFLHKVKDTNSTQAIKNTVSSLTTDHLNLLKFLLLFHSSETQDKDIETIQKRFVWEILIELQNRAKQNKWTAAILHGDFTFIYNEPLFRNALFKFLERNHCSEYISVFKAYYLYIDETVETIEYNEKTETLESIQVIQPLEDEKILENKKKSSEDLKKLILEANIGFDFKDSFTGNSLLTQTELDPVIKHLKTTIKGTFLDYHNNNIFWYSPEFYSLCKVKNLPIFEVAWDTCPEKYCIK